MSYSHQMTALPAAYDTAAIEKKWQSHWLEKRIYAWNPETPRADSYVIDTPPPTVSGTLHMGHVFSYTQADFIARFQRMNGKNVFYPMGFDDNGLPTERLVEKTKKIRASDMSREAFIAECLSVSEEARAEFRTLFRSIALSVDWDQEYHTISDASRRLSQLSFLDLVEKNEVYRAERPFFWDPVDQTAIAAAEIEDKELPSHACEIVFTVTPDSPPSPPQAGGLETGPRAEGLEAGPRAEGLETGPRAEGLETGPRAEGLETGPQAGELEAGPRAEGLEAKPQMLRGDEAPVSPLAGGLGGNTALVIMTTRPELLPACVALFCHPDDGRYTHLHGKTATVPLFGFSVPILTDDTVEMEKGTGLMMCCTFGDEADIAKWQKHQLPTRVVINKFGKMDFSGLPEAAPHLPPVTPLNNGVHLAAEKMDPVIRREDNPWAKLQGKKVSNADAKHPGARQVVVELLREAGLLVSQKPITHAVKCAERSGAPLEILPTHQWFVKVTDKKPALLARARECHWNPEWMRLRIEQWIEGLNQDWCISRQRFFGVPFPVWYSKRAGEIGKAIYATPAQLPCNPLVDLPEGYTRDEVDADPDVMDTWATSSISPQLSAGAINDAHSPRLRGDQGGMGRFGEHAASTRNQTAMAHAKAMRKEMTPAEFKLWELLSGKKLESCKFRRQQSIGHYIVDFVCMQKRLVIEVDGETHVGAEAYDAQRTAWLAAQGYRVIRFTNREVLENLEGVGMAIVEALQASPPSPPQAGGLSNGPQASGLSNGPQAGGLTVEPQAGGLSDGPRVLRASEGAVPPPAGGLGGNLRGKDDAGESSRFASLFPADLRPQAHEIIRTWAFYTLVKSHLHNASVPWHNLMISGWCLAEDKSKMSKSKGNVVTPVALIEERGTDAVRYWAGTSRLGTDTAFSPDLLKIGKKLVGKLWNATAFAAIHLSKLDAKPTTAATDAAITETLDRWILSRLHETVRDATEAFARYEYADALDATNRFFWADFCDNYLELIKKRVYNEDGSAAPAAQQSAVRTLYYVLDGILKLYAPFVPHVTEELYSHIFAEHYAAKGSLHAMGQWPKAGNYLHDAEALQFGELTKQMLDEVRKIKSEAKRSIKTPVTQAKIYISPLFLNQSAFVRSLEFDLSGAGNIESVEWQPTAHDGAAIKVEATLAAEADAA